jgi:hypothetical protein
MLPILFLLAAQTADTLTIHPIARPPRPDTSIDSAQLGTPQVRLRTRQATAFVWLLRSADTIFIAASIPDTTPYWGDDFVLSLDTQGDGAPNLQEDDFQWYLRRVLDSSVVFRGRGGRWEPPRGDPDWRLGRERSGGGWEISGRNEPRGWTFLLRLDPAWFGGEGDHRPRIAFRIYDDAPSGWFAWPGPPGAAPATNVERSPALWAPVRPDS